MKPVSWTLLLILAPSFVPAMASAAPPPATVWTVADTPGDQTLGPGFAPGGAPIPSNGAYAHSDFKSITIQDEDTLGIAIVYHVAALKVQPADHNGFSVECNGFGGSAGNGNPVDQVSSFNAFFELAGTKFTYKVGVNVYGGYTGTDASNTFVATGADGYLCLEQTSQDRRNTILQSVEVTLDEATASIRAWVPKASLLGIGTSPFRFFGGPNDSPRPAGLAMGDHLTKFQFQSSDPFALSSIVFVGGSVAQVQDSAPDGGSAPDYVFQYAAANQHVALRIGDEMGLLSVATGVNQSVPFSVENKAAGKAILKLTYAVEGAKAGAFEINGPPSVSVPGSETRNFTLSLKVPPGAKPEDLVYVAVSGDSVGSLGDVAFGRALVTPVPVLGPGTNILYLHGRSGDPGLDPFGLAFCTAVPGACASSFLTPLETDSLAGNPDRIQFFVAPVNPTAEMSGFFPSASQIVGSPSPLAFDVSQPIVIDLRLKATSEMTGVRLKATIDYVTPDGGDGAILAEASETATVSATGTTVTMRAPPQLPAGTILPAGTRFTLGLEAAIPVTPTNAPAAAPGGLEAEGGATRFSLPLVALPADLQLGAVPSPFQLGLLGDRQEFVNPGEGRLFNVTLLNQAATEQDAHVVIEARPAGWTAKVIPGADFRLKPGDTIRIGLLLMAPADAKEGAEGTVWMNVTSGDATSIGTRVSALATSGVDLPDDSAFTGSDAEARERLIAGPKHGTPGLEAIVVLGAILALAARRRR